MIETIFLVPHTHTDLGYTDRVANVLIRQVGILDQALELCSQSDDYRWTIESACILRHWWKDQSEAKRRQAIELLRNGRWQLMGLEMQLLTELSRAAELRANAKWALEFAAEHRFPVRGIMLNDIAGYARGLPSVAAKAGIEYLVGGVGGFRVLLPWADLPPLFRWNAPDGAGLLVWHLGLSSEQPPESWEGMPSQYGFGNSYCLWPVAQSLRGLDDTDPEKVKFETTHFDEAWRIMEGQLERRGYPYRQVLLQCAGDNRGIDPEAPRLVELWNRNVDRPKLRLATADEFFQELRRDVADADIPELSGDLHDPWSDLAPTYPKAYSLYRTNARRLEALRANVSTAVAQRHLEAAEHQQLWFSEHTFALSAWDELMPPLRQDNLQAPELQPWIDSWTDKEAYPQNALEEIVATEGAEIAPGLAYTGLREPVDATIRAGTDWFYIQNVSEKAAVPVLSGEKNLVEAVSGTLPVSDEYWRVGFDEDGALKILEAANAGPIFDLEAGFADIRVYDVDGMLSVGLPRQMLQRPQFNLRNVRWNGIESTRQGSVLTEVARHGHIALPEGEQTVEQSWRLLHREGVLEIETCWNKKPRIRREVAYLALPLKIHGPQVHIDQGLTMATVGQDELPGCFRDQYTVQDWIGICGGAQTLLVASAEAGLVEIDRIHFHEYSTTPFAPETGSLFFLLSHNCWPTNCPRWQEGDLRFTIRLKMLPAWQTADDLRRAGARLAWPVQVSGEY